jgi:hypothetical protein
MGLPRAYLHALGELDNQWLELRADNVLGIKLLTAALLRARDPALGDARTVDGRALADALPSGDFGAITAAEQLLFNATTWDRKRANVDATALASAVRSATTNSADQVNFNGRGLIAVFDVTAVPGVQTVTLELQGRDVTSGLYYTILASAAIAAVSTTVLRIYPGTAAVANLAADHPLPRAWRARVVHSGAGNFTYSVGASVLW